MDNLTHTLLAAALARTRMGRLSPYAAPVLIVGANLPDLDVLARLWGGREAYLVHHRGLTHGLPGVALQALVLAGLLRWIERRRERRLGEPTGSWRGAFALSAAALFSHPALDWLNTYGLRPWLPFDGRWIYGDVAFIVDPWLWLLLGMPALLAGPRSTAGTLAWIFLLSLGAAAVVSATLAGMVARPAAAAWTLGLALLSWARVRGAGEGWAVAWTRMGLGGASFYLLALLLLGIRAESAGRAAFALARPAGEVVTAVTRAPGPLDPLRWSVLVETTQAVYVQELHLATGPGRSLRLEKLLDDPAVQEALASPCSEAWRGFVRHPHAGVTRAPGGVWVELMDARYQQGPTAPRPGSSDARPSGTWSSAVVLVGGSGAVCGEDP